MGGPPKGELKFLVNLDFLTVESGGLKVKTFNINRKFSDKCKNLF